MTSGIVRGAPAGAAGTTALTAATYLLYGTVTCPVLRSGDA